jgi:hypothetical protein
LSYQGTIPEFGEIRTEHHPDTNPTTLTRSMIFMMMMMKEVSMTLVTMRMTMKTMAMIVMINFNGNEFLLSI